MPRPSSLTGSGICPWAACNTTRAENSDHFLVTLSCSFAFAIGNQAIAIGNQAIGITL